MYSQANDDSLCRSVHKIITLSKDNLQQETQQCHKTRFSHNALSIFSNSDLDLDLIDPKIKIYAQYGALWKSLFQFTRTLYNKS